MKIKFLGAAKNVTGSRFLLENNGKYILIDCGLYQERKFRSRNWEEFPIDPGNIECVLLTHAHIDHCGYLPKLVREGYRGKIYCTPPTAEIAKIALLDSAHLQESDIEYKRKRHRKKRTSSPYPEIPLYTVRDAEKAISLFEPISYKKEFAVTKDLRAIFYDAGHILGSAMIELRKDSGSNREIYIFSGDIGRWNRPILKDPTLFEKADHVFMESTYGNRIHENESTALEKIQKVILETHKAGGNIIIPSFAIERAQELIYSLGILLRQKKIPQLTVFVDSPMAINVTEVFKKYSSYFDKEAQTHLNNSYSLFSFPLLKTTPTANDSKNINSAKRTSVVMAGSGMCTGGRIKYHLINNISRKESTILFVGYQAEGTLGREILEKPAKVRILGDNYPVYARIEKINGFSAHADKNELMRWISNFKKKPKKIFVLHGEENAVVEFSQTLKSNLSSEIITPEYKEEYLI
ncbi:MAG: MBL fold metallo-hydrolase [bacterium]